MPSNKYRWLLPWWPFPFHSPLYPGCREHALLIEIIPSTTSLGLLWGLSQSKVQNSHAPPVLFRFSTALNGRGIWLKTMTGEIRILDSLSAEEETLPNLVLHRY